MKWIARRCINCVGRSNKMNGNNSEREKNRKDALRKEKGRLGEELAALLLAEQEYEILFRNYRCRFGEIDIIARKKGILVFVEVKTRTGNEFGEPAEAVTRSKQQKIRQTALHFLNEYRESFRGVEFQITEVLIRCHDGLGFREV